MIVYINLKFVPKKKDLKRHEFTSLLNSVKHLRGEKVEGEGGYGVILELVASDCIAE